MNYLYYWLLLSEPRLLNLHVSCLFVPIYFFFIPFYFYFFIYLTCPRCSSRHILYSSRPSRNYLFHFKYTLLIYNTTRRLFIYLFYVIYNFICTRSNLWCLVFLTSHFLYFICFLFSIFIKNFVLAAAPDILPFLFLSNPLPFAFILVILNPIESLCTL